MRVEGPTVGQTVASAALAFVVSAAGVFVMLGSDSARPVPVPEELPPPRIGLLVFEKTPVGEVLLEKPDHGGGVRPVLEGDRSLSVKVTNVGEAPFERLSLLLVGPDASVTWLMKSEPAPVGTDVGLPVVASVEGEGQYALLALFARRELSDGDVNRPLAQLREQRAKGRWMVPGFGSPEVAELRQEVEVQ